MRLIEGDCIEGMRQIEDASVNCCVTSPPYFGLRDYKTEGQIGLEPTPDEFVAALVAVFREVRRVLRDDGTLWLNLGDSYVGATSQHKEGGSAGKNYPISKKTLSGIPHSGWGDRNRALYESGLAMKQLIGIPWRVAFALQADGWYLRQDIIWHKPNPMPESVKDRCTKAHEYIFLLSKKPKYYFDSEAMREPAIYGAQHAAKATSWGTDRKHPNKANTKDYAFKGDNSTCYKTKDGHYMKNKRSVWTVTTKPFKGAHFAVFPPDLIEPCVLAGCPKGGAVLDPFTGSGTTGMVAVRHGRNFVGCELNPEYAAMARERITNELIGDFTV